MSKFYVTIRFKGEVTFVVDAEKAYDAARVGWAKFDEGCQFTGSSEVKKEEIGPAVVTEVKNGGEG